MIIVAGLGPGDFDRIPVNVKSLLTDPDLTVIVRTREHPAAAELASIREVWFCDDLYDSAESFEEVYAGIAQRVLTAAENGSVVYAVPGSPLMGELAVRAILSSRPDAEVIAAESFVDAILRHVGYDPLDRGLQILNGHHLPDPLILDKPTIVAQLDTSEVLAEVAALIDRVAPEGSDVTVLTDLGTDDASLHVVAPEDIESGWAGHRTSLFADFEPGGLLGAIHTMRRLRDECPWDKEQSHSSLVKNLVEEVFELAEAISQMPASGADWVADSRVEEELGDVLLQILFHEAIGRQRGAFDIDSIGEVLRAKLVRRHPHVFGDTVVDSAEEVKQNWDRIKASENPQVSRSSLDGVPTGMPALHRAGKIQNRAAKVGFDWEAAEQVVPKLREEIDEVEGAMGTPDVDDEIGDLLFSAVNLARHLGVDPELALRRATVRFETRFGEMEGEGPLEGLSLEEMDDRWQRAKDRLEDR